MIQINMIDSTAITTNILPSLLKVSAMAGSVFIDCAFDIKKASIEQKNKINLVFILFMF
jgi:hypothetical protein